MHINDSLFFCTWLLLRRFVQPSLVVQFKRGEIPHDQIKDEVHLVQKALLIYWFIDLLVNLLICLFVGLC